MALLEVSGLHAAFATSRAPLPVLADISFSLDAGETLGIVGESGSGKSMLVRSIVRLLPPSASITAGTVSFAGRDLATLRGKELDAVRGG